MKKLTDIEISNQIRWIKAERIKRLKEKQKIYALYVWNGKIKPEAQTMALMIDTNLKVLRAWQKDLERRRDEIELLRGYNEVLP